MTYWKVASSQQVELVNFINTNPVLNPLEVLTVSLVTVVDEIPPFVKFASSFVAAPISKLVLQSITNIQR